jgi:hypothetical protein
MKALKVDWLAAPLRLPFIDHKKSFNVINEH